MPEIAPSEELRAFVLRFYKTWETQDFAALREMVSAAAHLRVIGSDPEEWWSGHDTVELMIRQTSEMQGVRFESKRLEAYASGGMGWAADQPDVELGNGTRFGIRFTFVMAVERGHWRIVQMHASLGQKNLDAIGIQLTTSIEAVEKSVRESRPDMRPASAPDGTVTILFTDIESSTVLMERLGDTEFLRLLGWHDHIIRDIASGQRGFVVKSQGDGFMLAFPSAANALRASVLMRERIGAGFNDLPVRIRAGLHAGEAIKHDEDFYGRTVVVAARISALALGGEILASDLVHALARSLGTFKFGDARNVTLKGLEGEFGVHPVIG